MTASFDAQAAILAALGWHDDLGTARALTRQMLIKATGKSSKTVAHHANQLIRRGLILESVAAHATRWYSLTDTGWDVLMHKGRAS